MTCPFGFLVVLPDQMIMIPVDSHFSWLTMFYMLPKELVEKRPAYMNLPRNIRDIAYNEEYMKIMESLLWISFFDNLLLQLHFTTRGQKIFKKSKSTCEAKKRK